MSTLQCTGHLPITQTKNLVFFPVASATQTGRFDTWQEGGANTFFFQPGRTPSPNLPCWKVVWLTYFQQICLAMLCSLRFLEGSRAARMDGMKMSVCWFCMSARRVRLLYDLHFLNTSHCMLQPRLTDVANLQLTQHCMSTEVDINASISLRIPPLKEGTG